MKLEAGRRYVRRDNTVTPPLVMDMDEGYLYDPENKLYYDHLDPKDGWRIFPSSRKNHAADLVADFNDLMEL